MGHAAGKVVVLFVLFRQPDGLDGIETPRDGDHGCPAKKVGEAFRVERGGGDDHPQVGAAGQHAPEQAKQEVDIEAAFVGLIDNQRGILAEERVIARLGQQDAVGHELEARGWRKPPLEAVLIAHRRAEGRLHLLRQTPRHRNGRQAPRLRDPDQPTHVGPRHGRQFRQLRGLSGAGVAADDGDRVRTQRRNQRFGIGGNRQIRRDGEGRRHGRKAWTGYVCGGAIIRHHPPRRRQEG